MSYPDDKETFRRVVNQDLPDVDGDTVDENDQNLPADFLERLQDTLGYGIKMGYASVKAFFDWIVENIPRKIVDTILIHPGWNWGAPTTSYSVINRGAGHDDIIPIDMDTYPEGINGILIIEAKLDYDDGRKDGNEKMRIYDTTNSQVMAEITITGGTGSTYTPYSQALSNIPASGINIMQAEGKDGADGTYVRSIQIIFYT